MKNLPLIRISDLDAVCSSLKKYPKTAAINHGIPLKTYSNIPKNCFRKFVREMNDEHLSAMKLSVVRIWLISNISTLDFYCVWFTMTRVYIHTFKFL